VNVESERSKSFAMSISLQTKSFRRYFRVPAIGKFPPVPGNRTERRQNHDARMAVSATLLVLK